MSGQEAKEKGNAAFKAGNYASAIGFYTSAMLADSDNATYPLNRAAAYLKLGKSEDAERDCTRAIELDGKNVKAWFRRGQARAGLSHLDGSKKDFERVLQLEPKNGAAQQELKKVCQRLQERDANLKKASIAVQGAALPIASTPKRRRVPITIIDSNSSVKSAAPSPPTPPLQAKTDDLLQSMSSRPLTRATPSDDVTSGAMPDSRPSLSNVKKTTTFKEAKQARGAQQARSGGGIFRSNGQHTLFDTRSGLPVSQTAPGREGSAAHDAASKVPTPGPTAFPREEQALLSVPKSDSLKIDQPVTLFNFLRTWDSLREPDTRWDLLRQVPPLAIPSLFKTSLEASMLVSILETLQHVLQSSSATTDLRALVRDYLINLAHVPRFSTITLFMSAEERRLVRDVWDSLADIGGSYATEKKAWGTN